MISDELHVLYHSTTVEHHSLWQLPFHQLTVDRPPQVDSNRNGFTVHFGVGPPGLNKSPGFWGSFSNIETPKASLITIHGGWLQPSC